MAPAGPDPLHYHAYPIGHEMHAEPLGEERSILECRRHVLHPLSRLICQIIERGGMEICGQTVDELIQCSNINRQREPAPLCKTSQLSKAHLRKAEKSTTA